MSAQLDLFAHCPAKMAQLYRQDADTQRVNPYMTATEREQFVADRLRNAERMEELARKMGLPETMP